MDSCSVPGLLHQFLDKMGGKESHEFDYSNF